MIELRDVHKEYRSAGETSVVLERCTLDVPDGAFVAVLGPSGSGKTTLLNLIGGLDTATSGSVLVEGVDLGRLDRWGLTDVRRRTIGFVFQFYNLIPTLTARENVMCTLELLDVAPEEARRRTDEMLAAVGLEGKGDLFPSQLSGGQQQRVAIARALVKRPPLLLADEPTGNLDRKLGAQIMDLLVALREESGTTLVVVTHDPDVARRADLVVRIDEGGIELQPGAGASSRGEAS
jgi:putative ABC transport system ATP-binding protein